MTTHQDTSAEHDLVANMRALEADHEPDGWPAVRMSTISHLCDVIERMQAALASRPAATGTEREKCLAAALLHIKYTSVSLADAQVIALEALASRDEAAQQTQGQTPDHSKLLKMIAHRARCFPSYPMGYHLPEVFAAVGEAPPEHTVPVPQGQAVSDEEIERLAHRTCWQYRHSSDPHHSSTYKFNLTTLLDYSRAILALRDKPDHFPGATKMMPLSDDFATIAGLESAVGHLSTLVDEQRALLVESEDVFGRDGHGGRYEDGECNLIDRIRAHLEMTAPPPNGITAKEQGRG